ncbi:hypothetical protein COV56_01565, partial [Candidatus Kuenenbacteria bacterium CG11_big_fil_rev_8_21_14_0_20_37_9]
AYSRLIVATYNACLSSLFFFLFSWAYCNKSGLPKNMKMKLLEPLRYYYTDEVRKIGLQLGLPKNIVYQQP